MSLKEKIDLERLPEHVAIIMDGNGRWAKERGKMRLYGHRHGVESVREAAEAAAEIGIKYLTLYAFSTENWSRPKAEITALMRLLVQTINKETKTLHDNNIRLLAIGDLQNLPKITYRELISAIRDTSKNDRMAMILALSYSSRWEITKAVQHIASDVASGKLLPQEINQQVIGMYMETSQIPDPELVIRTSGEYRISNFLLWQVAYSELYFTPKYWPDFRKEDLYAAILDYQSRERRFGKTSEQLITK